MEIEEGEITVPANAWPSPDTDKVMLSIFLDQLSLNDPEGHSEFGEDSSEPSPRRFNFGSIASSH